MTAPAKIERAEGGHTPGPWGFGYASNYEGYYVAPLGKLPTLAAVQAKGINAFNYPNETEANARLIAASPELLAHLEFAVKLLRQFGHSAQVQAMEAVIAKARGAA